MSDVVREHGIVIRYLGTLAETNDYRQTSSRSRVFAKAGGVLHMDCIDDRLVHKLNCRISIEVGSQSSGDGQQGECIDQDLEQAELQPAIGNIRI